MHYRVELENLLAFVDTLRAFEQRAEATAMRVDQEVSRLHESWDGDGAAGHVAMYQEWMGAARQMREALTHLRETAHNAHRNYTDAVALNVAMLA